ncbi:MAG TPA: cyclic phosphodiesterase-like protein, partial [Coleofasciculaceae cyanobacterium]
MSTKVSYWLIPSAENRAFFQEIIDSLASQYNAPRFIPHVTIYSGESSPDQSPSELIERATQGVQGFRLSMEQLLYSNELTKTL